MYNYVKDFYKGQPIIIKTGTQSSPVSWSVKSLHKTSLFRVQIPPWTLLYGSDLEKLTTAYKRAFAPGLRNWRWARAIDYRVYEIIDRSLLFLLMEEFNINIKTYTESDHTMSWCTDSEKELVTGHYSWVDLTPNHQMLETVRIISI